MRVEVRTKPQVHSLHIIRHSMLGTPPSGLGGATRLDASLAWCRARAEVRSWQGGGAGRRGGEGATGRRGGVAEGPPPPLPSVSIKDSPPSPRDHQKSERN